MKNQLQIFSYFVFIFFDIFYNQNPLIRKKHFPHPIMKSTQIKLLETIEENYNNLNYLHLSLKDKGIYMSQISTSQQIFLEKLINIYALRKKQYNKIDQERVQHLIQTYFGSFTDILLTLRYMSFCMENKVEVSYDKFGMLKLLTNWMDTFQRIKTSPKVNLSVAVFNAVHPQNHTIGTFEQLIVYINYIAADLQTILQRTSSKPKDKTINNQSNSQIQGDKIQYTYDHLDIDDLLNLLNNILPKVLFNVVFPEHFITGHPMTSTNPADQKQRDFLYGSRSHQYFAKQKNHYQKLLKIMINLLLKFTLTQSQQKILLQIGFKYFYLFNREKNQQPFSLFTKIYEKISEAVKFASSDQFLLFFRVIKKLGHYKFIDFLKSRYQWIQQLLSKIDPTAVVGHPKDNINFFQGLSIMQHIYLNPGTTTQRYIQILQPYSIFYFYIGIKTLDINIRLYYIGQFSSQIQKKKLLINKQKSQFQYRGNIITLQKGIYMFEFDNSYSWMKGKSLYYETVVLTPLEIKNSKIDEEKFTNVLFNKYQMNQCSRREIVDVMNYVSLGQKYKQKYIQLKKKPEVQEEDQIQDQNEAQVQQRQILIGNSTQNQLISNNVNLQYLKQNQCFSLKSISRGRIYQYETQKPQFLLKKINQIINMSNNNFNQWYINGKWKVDSLQMIQNWSKNPQNYENRALREEQHKQNQNDGRIGQMVDNMKRIDNNQRIYQEEKQIQLKEQDIQQRRQYQVQQIQKKQDREQENINHLKNQKQQNQRTEQKQEVIKKNQEKEFNQQKQEADGFNEQKQTKKQIPQAEQIHNEKSTENKIQADKTQEASIKKYSQNEKQQEQQKKIDLQNNKQIQIQTQKSQEFKEAQYSIIK